MIEAKNLTKRYKKTTAVDDLSFTVEKGLVTGFLGPNGSGKSTTMRMILGLDTPTSGEVTINGAPYTSLNNPLTVMGSLLDAGSIHPKRSAKNHLKVLCLANNINTNRVDHCLQLVGLTEVADKPAGSFSLGMKQRLGIAGALLGDPEYLMLDEPVNGLDPEGIRWVRDFLTALAAEGRGVFVSSHQLGELSKMSDRLVVIGQGKMISNDTTDAFVSANTSNSTIIHTSDDTKLAEALRTAGFETVPAQGTAGIVVSGVSAEDIGTLALQVGVATYKMSSEFGLEDAFIRATQNSAQYTTDSTDLKG